MNKHVLIILSCICLVGCNNGDIYEHLTIAEITFTNNSSHTITVKSDNNPYVSGQSSLEFSIAPGKSYQKSCTGNTYVPEPRHITGMRCFVIFDKIIEITHGITSSDKSITHNICDYDSFVITHNSEHKITYTYTFTDEDYERAVAANAGSGE